MYPGYEQNPYGAELLNKRLIPKSKNILLYLLPSRDQDDVVDSLRELPFPVITMRKPFGFPSGRVFPHDMGIRIGDTFHGTHEHIDIVGQVFRDVGLEYVFPRILRKGELVDMEGGNVVVSVRHRIAVTGERSIQSLMTKEGYQVGMLRPEHIMRLLARSRGDWTYALPHHVDNLVHLYAERGRATVEVDETVAPHIEIESDWKWKIRTRPHRDAILGRNNLAYLGVEIVLAPENTRGTATIERLEKNRHKVLFQPDAVVADRAGPKCRSLFLSYG